MTEPEIRSSVDVNIGGITLSRGLIGKEVIYRPRGGAPYDIGKISSWNRQYVFVRYGGQTAKATRPADLAFCNDPYSDLKLKFLIYDGEIIAGKVQLHKHLLPSDADHSLIAGGGSFWIDRERKEVVFYGKSFDFGAFEPIDIARCKPASRMEDLTPSFIKS